MENRIPLCAIFILSVLLAFGIGTFSGHRFHNGQVTESTVIERINEKKAELLDEAIVKAKETVELRKELASVRSIKVPLPNGEMITAPEGSLVDIEMRGPTRTASAGKSRKITTGDSRGGFKWNASATDITSVGAPNLDLTEDAEKGSGGAFSTSLSAVSRGAKSGTNVLLFVGIALVLAGILVIIFLKLIRTGLIVAGAGGAFILVALLIQAYPWVLLVGAIAVACLIGYFLYSAWKNGRIDFTLKKVTQGIEQADPDAQVKVKEEIKKQAATQKEAKIIKSTVTKVKDKLNI